MPIHPINVDISKEAALKAFGGNGCALARALRITPQAVYQWDANKPIPEKQALRLLTRMPKHPWRKIAAAERRATQEAAE